MPLRWIVGPTGVPHPTTSPPPLAGTTVTTVRSNRQQLTSVLQRGIDGLIGRLVCLVRRRPDKGRKPPKRCSINSASCSRFSPNGLFSLCFVLRVHVFPRLNYRTMHLAAETSSSSLYGESLRTPINYYSLAAFFVATAKISSLRVSLKRPIKIRMQRICLYRIMGRNWTFSIFFFSHGNYYPRSSSAEILVTMITSQKIFFSLQNCRSASDSEFLVEIDETGLPAAITTLLNEGKGEKVFPTRNHNKIWTSAFWEGENGRWPFAVVGAEALLASPARPSGNPLFYTRKNN